MKSETKHGETTSTMTGKGVKMGVRAEDMGQIMAILTDIYSDSLRAVVREYSCNAYDAHKESGVTLPIQLTLPTRFNPSLSITDFGVGMDADTIENVYAQYGRSTKRDSNEQIGGFGIGCKSALSYTSQFTVTSVKDGYKVIVLISRDEDDAGLMEILNAPDDADETWRGEEVEEGNGTTVSVAIRADDQYKVSSIAKEFFQYWEKGTVLIDDQQPEHFADSDSVLKIGDGLYLVEGGYEDKIVMGGVPYPPLPAIERPNYNSPQYGIIAFVDIGDVTPHPSREQLRDTRQTKDTILGTESKPGIMQKLHDGLAGLAQREIDKAANHAEALQAMLKWQRYDTAMSKTVNYKGDVMPKPFVAQTSWPTESAIYPYVYSTSFSHDSYNKKSTTRRQQSVEPAVWPQLVWITGFEPQKLTSTHKDKMLQWAKQNSIGFRPSGTVDQYGHPTYLEKYPTEVSSFVLLRGADTPDSPFIDSKRIVSWDTIKDVKIPRPPKSPFAGAGRLSGSYDLYTENGLQTQVPADKISTMNTLVWIQGNRWAADRVLASVAGMHTKFTIVFLGANRVEKFKRDFPKARPADDVIREGAKKWAQKQTKKDLMALAMSRNGIRSNYNALDESKIDDPRLKNAVLISKRDIDTLLSEARVMLRRHPELHDDLVVQYDDPIQQYRLYRAGWAAKPDMYLYLNAKYAQIKADKQAASAKKTPVVSPVTYI